MYRYLFIIPTLWCFTISAQQYPDRHNTTIENTWLSCTPSSNPNPARGVSHWIKYDFGTTYALNQSNIWNVNAYQNTNNGAQEIEIDYSIDGVVWRNWGRYNLSQAEAKSNYQGEPGPNFNGLVARHLLITITSNYGGTCSGLSEFRVQSSPVTVSSDETEELADGYISAYPNPFIDILQVKIEDGVELGDNSFYQIFDVKGSLIAQEKINNRLFQITNENLNTGAYQIKVVTSQGFKTLSVNLIK